ncbi:hypothetical protein EVAR_28091_1 [Eumeta japonica]|uniref:Uncharacterized protein n=1 Tax=Eumeta variegata TaxID=151549 RepID=A0A4C1W8K0_EUMVA|nr:hypothetical protein EVAR_28091_1 [Eumeta japonica]
MRDQHRKRKRDRDRKFQETLYEITVEGARSTSTRAKAREIIINLGIRRATSRSRVFPERGVAASERRPHRAILMFGSRNRDRVSKRTSAGPPLAGPERGRRASVSRRSSSVLCVCVVRSDSPRRRPPSAPPPPPPSPRCTGTSDRKAVTAAPHMSAAAASVYRLPTPRHPPEFALRFPTRKKTRKYRAESSLSPFVNLAERKRPRPPRAGALRGGRGPRGNSSGSEEGVTKGMTPELCLCLTIVIKMEPVLTEPRMRDPPNSKVGSALDMSHIHVKGGTNSYKYALEKYARYITLTVCPERNDATMLASNNSHIMANHHVP